MEKSTQQKSLFGARKSSAVKKQPLPPKLTSNALKILNNEAITPIKMNDSFVRQDSEAADTSQRQSIVGTANARSNSIKKTLQGVRNMFSGAKKKERDPAVALVSEQTDSVVFKTELKQAPKFPPGGVAAIHFQDNHMLPLRVPPHSQA